MIATGASAAFTILRPLDEHFAFPALFCVQLTARLLTDTWTLCALISSDSNYLDSIRLPYLSFTALDIIDTGLAHPNHLFIYTTLRTGLLSA